MPVLNGLYSATSEKLGIEEIDQVRKVSIPPVCNCRYKISVRNVILSLLQSGSNTP
jgi:hypothetical protein